MKTLGTALGVLGGCIAARWYLNRTSRRDTEFCGGRVRLTALWNEGAAFGLPLPKTLLPAVSGAALLLVWLRRKSCPAGAGLVIGGGASNLLERMEHRRVYDYIQFPKAPAPWKRYVFNLADLAILAGCGILAAGLCLPAGHR